MPTYRSRLLAGITGATLFSATLFGAVLTGVVTAPTASAAQDPSDSDVHVEAATCDANGGIPGGLTRDDILARGKRWVDANVSYSWDDCNSDGGGRDYRTDCSGFVSMAWGLGTSYTTANFVNDTSNWKSISWSDLQPGDALVHPKDSSHPYGHVVLFVSWADSDHTKINIYEERGTDYGTVASTYTKSYADDEGFHAIRYQHIKDATPPAPTMAEGSYISYAGAIYRIAGHAPVYVSNWANVGGQQTATPVTADQIGDLNPVPANGTFIRDHGNGRVYVVAGGAPMYVSTWSAFPNANVNIIDLDGAVIDRAGSGGTYNHLRAKPSDGTFIRDSVSGAVFRVAGGAPIYVSNWAAFGGIQRFTNVDGAVITRAGQATPFNHLNARPTDGVFIRDTDTGAFYRTAGGAPVYVSTWSAFPSTSSGYPTVTIDGAAFAHAGEDGWWSHLAAHPADGTFITGAQTGQVYRIAGGAPVYVSTWSAFDPGQTTTDVDQTAIDRAGQTGFWSFLNGRPADGTFVVAAQSGAVYRVVGGAPIYVSSWVPFGGNKPAVGLDQAALDRAGDSGPYAHLDAHPADGTLLQALPSGVTYSVSAGHLQPYTGTASVPTSHQIDQYAVDHAGQDVRLSHLLP